MEQSAPGRTSSLWRASHGLVFALLTVAILMLPPLRVWPLAMLVPIGLYLVLAAVVPALRTSFRPWIFGSRTNRATLATLILAVGSSAMLVLFHLYAKPDVSFLRGTLPISSLGGLLAAGAFFSIVNALLEELIFRGIFFDSVEALWGNWVAALTTSAVFGYFHMHGYPPGVLGAILAGAFALCLSGLRVYTGGLGLPVVAHIVADATIFTILATQGAL